MRSFRFLLFNRPSTLCRAGHYAKLRYFLRQYFPESEAHEENDYQKFLHSNYLPDIIFLTLAQCVEFQERFDKAVTFFPKASIVGIFCTDDLPQREHISSLANMADEFLFCPFQEKDVLFRINKVLQARLNIMGHYHTTLNGDEILKEQPVPLIGNSPPFRKTLAQIPLLANTQATVLITGETGTGKELLARAIHYSSPRKSKPFIPLNCGAVPEHLFENELFGHGKGAFTDAHSEQKGLIEEAEGGTLFLDEIDTLTSSAQIKLLRFLQEKEFRPLGCTTVRNADVRIIGATNANLTQLQKERKFRPDLFYRLQVLSLNIPPLRERREDIPVLAEYFLGIHARDHKQPKRPISLSGLQKLLSHDWPGNVRELDSVMKRAVILKPTGTLDSKDFSLPESDEAKGTIRSLRYTKLKFVESFEEQFLRNLLLTHRGNISHAARAAGKERRCFQRLLKKHGLDRSEFLNTA